MRSGSSTEAPGAMRVVLTWVVVVLCSVPMSGAFNMDVQHFTRFYGSRPGDMFGFSVALHKEATSGDSWVLVGAPEAQSERQRQVQRGGAVYRCDIARDRCFEVPFDQSDGNNRNATRHDVDNKSHQWFGATLAAAESGTAVVACAPRYVYYARSREERHDPVGSCWVARDRFSRFSEYAPCRTSEWGYHRKGYCQAGLGASISKDGKQLFIGAPGSRYWQGQAFTVDATVFMPFLPPETIRVNITGGQLFGVNLHKRPEVYETKEGPPTDDDTYLGYSVAVGYFDGPENTTLAVGRPRGDNLKGKVEIYSWDLVLLVDISGDQLGGYFGYSLCASDMDGDGRDDLVVGTPLYTEPNNEGKYETGRFYVFYQKGDYDKNDTRDGINSRSRFGLSLSSLGDINKDGYGDIAVGAPYDDPDGRGAVYIYLGSKDGIREKPSQIIFAKDVSQDLSTFGFSVSGGLDLDNNYYPDLVIGAYESNSAAFFRARPIVKVDANVTFLETGSRSGSLKQVNLKNHNCNLQGNGKNDTICLVVRFCLTFNGLGVDQWHFFNVEVVLDAVKSRSPRMYFRDSSVKENSRNITIRVVKNWPFCRDFDIYIKPNLRDKLTSLNVEMRYSLQESQQDSRQRELTPVLDLALPPVKTDTLQISKNCGPDNICIPDLKMKIEPSVEQYLLGSGEDFKLKVLVDNKAEDAFEASYSLKIPRGLNYINIARLDKNQDVTVQCSPPSLVSNNTLICDIGNPLPSKKHVEFNVLMQPFYTEGLRSQYRFEMEVNSTNPEKATTRKDNKKTLEIPISIQTDISLMGASYPSDVHWNSMDYSKAEGFTEESEIGPQVVHVHTIHNKGPADIVEAEVYVVVPTTTFANDNILYLLQQPETTGPIECERVPEANFLNIKLENNRQISFFENQERLTGNSETSVTQGATSSSQSGTGVEQSSKERGREYKEGSVSEGNVRGGGSFSQEERYYGHGSTHHLVGVEGEKAIHKDEGLDSFSGTFGGGGSGYSYQHSSSNKNFQNSSHSSRRVESQSGGFQPKVYSSSNFSSSWSENGGPIHHYENHTSEENGVHQGSSEKHHNGRGQSGFQPQTTGERTGVKMRYNESTTYYSGASGSVASQPGRGYSNNAAVAQNKTRVNSGTYQGSSVEHHVSTSGSDYNSRGHTDGRTVGQGYANTHSGDSVGYRYNQKGYEGKTSTHTNTQTGYNANEENYYESEEEYDNENEGNDNAGDYNDNDESYRRQYGVNHESNQDVSRRVENTSQSRNTFKTTGSDSNSRRDNIGRDNVNLSQSKSTSKITGSDSSSRQSNIGYDNAKENQKNVAGQYDRIGSQSSERTHQYSGNAYNTGDISHSNNQQTSSNTRHYSSSSSSSWGSSTGSSYNQDQNYRGGSYGDDTARKYFSSNWDENQNQDFANRNQGSVNSGSKAGSSSGSTSFDQRGSSYGDTQESGGTGHFYTSSVLLGERGNVDLGYAARGYGNSQDAFSNINSRRTSNKDNRKTTVDPDLADLGAQFTDRPEPSQDQHSQNGQFRLYGRYQRSITESSLEDLVKCNATNCTKIHCILGPLIKGQEVRVALRMRVWVPTMKKLKDNRIIKTSSLIALQVKKLPYIGSPHEAIIRDHEVFTDIVSTDSPTIPDIVPLWVVVLSAVAGTVILLLLIFLLWKCGFFKRNRPADAAEKEPLNRNGHYSTGDEAL